MQYGQNRKEFINHIEDHQQVLQLKAKETPIQNVKCSQAIKTKY